jgi:hypothetical protein
MLYAHLFKKSKAWILLISDSAAINGDHVISETAYENKTAAKKAAAALGAKPWNY